MGENRVFFATSSAEVLNSDLAAISIPPGTKVAVVGFADRRGTKAFNQVLSERRAKTVAAKLSKNLGVQEDRVSIQGAGVDEQAPQGDHPEARRVEIRLVPSVPPAVPSQTTKAVGQIADAPAENQPEQLRAAKEKK